MASNRTHIYIHDSKFIGNFGDDFGILNAKFDNELPNIKLANLYVFANAVSNGPIISITCKELKPKFIEDSIQEKLFFIIWEGQNGIVKKRHAEFNDLTMIKNVAGNSGLIVFEKLAHVSIKSLVLDQNAPDDSSNINTLFIQKFLNSNIYLTETVKNPASLDCQFLGKFSNIYSLSLYVFIRNNTCLTSSPNLSIENPSKLIINNFDCLYNTANGKNPSCLSVSTDELPIEMSNSRITGNINNYSGGLGALSISTKNATALIKNLEFEANSADLGSSIHFTGKTLILVDVIFKNEKSLEKSLGVIYYSPLIDGSSPELIITGCTF